MTFRFIVLAVAFVNLLPRAAYCAEIRIFCPGAYVDALAKLSPTLERETTHRVIVLRDGPSNIVKRVRDGEDVDIVILPEDALNELNRDGYIATNGRKPLAVSSIGMVVRAGVPKPDIGSVDALRRTLIEAKSIAHSSQISGVYLTMELLPRLGIDHQVRSKLKRIEKERVALVVARGEAEIGIQQISELLSVRGIDYVGPLPKQVQRTTLFSAGISARSKHPAPAKDVIAFLTSPAADLAASECGLEPAIRH